MSTQMSEAGGDNGGRIHLNTEIEVGDKGGR